MPERLVIIPAWYPTHERPESGAFVRDQAECLAQRFEVTVIAPRVLYWRSLLRGGPRLQIEQHGGAAVWRVREFALPGPVHALRKLRDRASAGARLLGDVYARAVGWALDRYVATVGKPALLHAHVVLPAGWAAMHHGRRLGIPVVLTEHSGPFATHTHTADQRRRVDETMAGVSRVVAVSPALAGAMRDAGVTAPIDVVGNVIRASRFTPPSRPRVPGQMRIFSLALLTREKGMHHLLDAMAMLHNAGVSDWELVIGGDGPARSELDAQLRASPIASRCKFVGMLDRERVLEWMRWCDVFVSASLGETFGVAICEAMACGKPVVATRCGGPEFTVNADAGVLVPPGDPAALAEGIRRVVRSEAAFDAARIRAGVVERFGERAFTDTMAALYADVLRDARKHEAPRQ